MLSDYLIKALRFKIASVVFHQYIMVYIRQIHGVKIPKACEWNEDLDVTEECISYQAQGVQQCIMVVYTVHVYMITQEYLKGLVLIGLGKERWRMLSTIVQILK